MSDARIELLCGFLPPDPTPQQQRAWDDTTAMHKRAAAVAEASEIPDSFTTHGESDGDYSDAYLYPSVEMLSRTLDGLDAANVEYDYVDLPADAPEVLTAALESRFEGTDVTVTTGKVEPNAAAAPLKRQLSRA